MTGKTEIIGIIGHCDIGSSIAHIINKIPIENSILIISQNDEVEAERGLSILNDKPFIITRTPQMVEPIITREDLEKHPFDKFINKKKKRKR